MKTPRLYIRKDLSESRLRSLLQEWGTTGLNLQAVLQSQQNPRFISSATGSVRSIEDFSDGRKYFGLCKNMKGKLRLGATEMHLLALANGELVGQPYDSEIEFVIPGSATKTIHRKLLDRQQPGVVVYCYGLRDYATQPAGTILHPQGLQLTDETGNVTYQEFFGKGLEWR
ncbi:MAG: hypothetical protein WC796_06110 [Candidatus Pacearchaeota archaeon]|jgi:hypothetical protein